MKPGNTHFSVFTRGHCQRHVLESLGPCFTFVAESPTDGICFEVQCFGSLYVCGPVHAAQDPQP